MRPKTANPADAAANAVAHATAPTTAVKILIADDEPHIRHVLSHKLRGAGYDVTVAQDGNEALERARESRPQLLVTDCQMPGMDGIDLCRQLEQDPATAHIPTIMLTSRDFEIGQEQTRGTSIQRVLGKPFSPRQVLSLIAELLQTAA